MGYTHGQRHNTTFDVVALGWHMAYCTQCVVTKSKRGDDMWRMRWQILLGGDKGRRIAYQHVMLVDEDWGYGRVTDILDAFDPKADRSDANPHSQQWSDSNVVAQACWVKVKHRLDQKGEKQAEVVEWKALTAADCDKLEAEYGDGQGFIVPPLPDDAFTESSTPASSGFSDDDIPL